MSHAPLKHGFFVVFFLFFLSPFKGTFCSCLIHHCSFPPERRLTCRLSNIQTQREDAASPCLQATAALCLTWYMFHAVYSINMFFLPYKRPPTCPSRRFKEIKLLQVDRHLQATATKASTAVEKNALEGGLKAESGEKSDKGGFPSTNFKLKCGRPRIQDRNGPLFH